jgi:hypothetical protein
VKKGKSRVMYATDGVVVYLRTVPVQRVKIPRIKPIALNFSGSSANDNSYASECYGLKARKRLTWRI